MHPAIAVANYLLEKAQATRTPVNGAQLQCLTYFAHGLRLALVNLPLLDEAVLADRDGIHLASIGQSGIGTNRSVTRLLTHVQQRDNGLLDEVAPVLDERDPAIPTLDTVWARFGGFSAYDLSIFVRGTGSPWDHTWNDPARLEGQLSTTATQVWEPEVDNGRDRSVVIPNSLIRRWFRQLVIQENRDQSAADGLDRTIMVGRSRLEETANLAPLRHLRAR